MKLCHECKKKADLLIEIKPLTTAGQAFLKKRRYAAELQGRTYCVGCSGPTEEQQPEQNHPKQGDS